jgi:septum formation inhibitor-activating ATPase MinD
VTQDIPLEISLKYDTISCSAIISVPPHEKYTHVLCDTPAGISGGSRICKSCVRFVVNTVIGVLESGSRAQIIWPSVLITITSVAAGNTKLGSKYVLKWLANLLEIVIKTLIVISETRVILSR